MNSLVSEHKPFGTEERNLLSVAYKNVVYKLRASCRILREVHEKEQLPKYKAKVNAALQIVENEISQYCTTILKILDDLIQSCQDPESLVFYYKMQVDYNRYLAELSTKPNPPAVQATNEAYSKATDLASKLDPSHPLRLGLALNFSVFTADINHHPEVAIKIAKLAQETAQKQDNLTEDSLQLIQLLKENCLFWESGQ